MSGIPLILASLATLRPVDLVDPTIGVEGGGNVFPGPTLPYGLVKLGPDCGDLNPNAGYDASEIHGFSHVHVSGTGGGPKYGNVLFMPTVGRLDLHATSPRKDERISVGYYGAELTASGVKVELSASRRAGFHRYTFPASKDAHILIDLGHCLGIHSYPGESQQIVGGEVRIVSPTEIEGYTRVRGGWNAGRAYTVYFHAQFDTPAASWGTWKEDTVRKGSSEEVDSGEKVGAFLTYRTRAGQSIQAKVGISFLGIGKARHNALEIEGWDLYETVKKARDEWNDVLSKAQVEGGTEDQCKCFYTALYHAMLMPVDRTGENPNWSSKQPYYDDYYAIWDTFRTSGPLLTLIAPDRQRDMVRSLVDIYEHEGYMPDARSGDDTGRTQGGSNCDIMVADAYLKGLTGIDFEKAYRAMVKNAEVPPGDDERKQGRGGLADYNTIGYVSTDYERAGTRTMEYAVCDWAIAQVAHGLGKADDARKYRKRASNWQNLWSPVSDLGFEGFVWPRRRDGSWQTDGFSTKTGGSWGGFFYETDSWEYSFYVPQDVAKLIEKCGGDESFVKRLDTYFEKDYYQVGNEPSFLTPCLYTYAGRPDRTANQVRNTMAACYKATRDGLPGNDDSGAMSSWFAFNAMGFFPNAGQDLYLITSPLFSKVTLDLGGHVFVVIARNASDKNRYIASAVLNGKPWSKAWFRHADIKDGGTLVLEMTDKPTAWGTTDPPPSMSTTPDW